MFGRQWIEAGIEETKSKDSSQSRQGKCDNLFHRVSGLQRILSNITVNRRHNAIALFQRFAEEQMRIGIAPKGLEQSFAQRLQVSPSMWSQIKSSRPIGDKLARQIESAFGHDPGWLDEDRPSAGLTPAEQQFLSLALKAWRETNAEGRRRLKTIVKGSGTA